MKSDARMLNEGHDLARVSTSARKSRPRSHSSLIAVVLVLATFLPIKAVADAPATHRRAIVIGRGEPFRDPDGGKSHPQLAKEHFLKLVGNPDNDPAKGWTVELSWDLMLRHGFDPKTDCYEAFFNFIGRNHPEFRILIQNGPGGADAAAWGTAVDNGMIAFAPHGNNMVNLRIPDEVGIKACCSVAGGYSWRENSYGPGLEFFDAMPDNSPHGENAWQSWANQALAAKCARIFDMHPDYNNWDARQHLRQIATYWLKKGWNETNGYGRVTFANLSNDPGPLWVSPPVDFRAVRSHDARQVLFSWRNFKMRDFAATVIARADGRIIHEGTGTNFAWTADHDGVETFTYWSRSKSGQRAPMETYQTRTVGGLMTNGIPAVLVLGAAVGHEANASLICNIVRSNLPGWNCDVFFVRGNAAFDGISNFPIGSLLGLRTNWSDMVDYAISNRYCIMLAPVSEAEMELSRHTPLWQRATDASVAVVTPHYASDASYPGPYERTVLPHRLGAAITVGHGTVTNAHSFGPGLEFFDFGPPTPRTGYGQLSQNDSAAVLACKLGRVLEMNASFNIWDARQHLRQSASLYAAGWREDGGYGRPPDELARIAKLDPAPPLEIQAVKSPDGSSVTFAWVNFRQTDFGATVITKSDGRKIYEGSGTSFIWQSDVAGDGVFKFHTRNKAGELSRDEAYTVVRIGDLVTR